MGRKKRSAPDTRGPARGFCRSVGRDALDTVRVEDVQDAKRVHVHCFIALTTSSSSYDVLRARWKNDNACAAAHVECRDAALCCAGGGRGPAEEERVREELSGAVAPARGRGGMHVEVPDAAGV